MIAPALLSTASHTHNEVGIPPKGRAILLSPSRQRDRAPTAPLLMIASANMDFPTSGHLFAVLHPRGGDAPLRVTYAVAEVDRAKAEDILAIGLAEPDAEITHARELDAIIIEDLGLGPREYRSVWPTLEL